MPTESGKPATCAGGKDYRIADSTDGIHFGTPQLLSTAGVTENEQSENAAFGYDKDLHDWYMVGEFGAYTVGGAMVAMHGSRSTGCTVPTCRPAPRPGRS